MCELYSKLCGRKTTISQQKNTSFGANEFRDGVSYNERREQSPLVPYEDFGKLSIGECFAILPEISTRVAKIQTPEATIKDKNDWFVELVEDMQSDDNSKKQEANNTQNSAEGTQPKNSKPKKKRKNKSPKKKLNKTNGSKTKTKSKEGAKSNPKKQKRKAEVDHEIDFS